MFFFYYHKKILFIGVEIPGLVTPTKHCRRVNHKNSKMFNKNANFNYKNNDKIIVADSLTNQLIKKQTDESINNKEIKFNVIINL